MLTEVIALVVYIAAAFVVGEDEPRWGVFADKATCDAAVARIRAGGTFATDCVRVTMPTAKNGASS